MDDQSSINSIEPWRRSSRGVNLVTMPRLNMLFWNVARRDLATQVSDLVVRHEVNILLLAEAEGVTEAPLIAQGLLPTPGASTRIRFYTKFPRDLIDPVRDTGSVSIRQVRPPIGPSVLVVAAHLPSKLHRQEEDQLAEAIRIGTLIRQAELACGHTRTVVIGDLNMCPFESGVVAADGFHAVMDRNIASRGSRDVAREGRRFFYNPMWNFLGDDTFGPPGTHYYDKGGQVNYYWHMFDQVLIRPDLLKNYKAEDVQVLTEVGTVNLLSESGRPNDHEFSDHLPILLRLNISGD